MSTWQEVLKQRSITSLEALAERFEPSISRPSTERLRQAIDTSSSGFPADGRSHPVSG
jgi:hypothetical protein